ncbi:hypothetical protein LF1_50180 [Rubripirellula obstinata]|uniref:Ice-binding protein C-terminal domain-containing protein n=1 Tax=Rubripirellula obstinata TaxID=406547 RepID=A0A5B1CTA4_9BACT|nr:PEP-CTERM sorting domain-containing protein [Rubripirellula obstinata]KAA1262454.1 hypothetical protein LF1_50180 [Rubripirellula obstinata]
MIRYFLATTALLVASVGLASSARADFIVQIVGTDSQVPVFQQGSTGTMRVLIHSTEADTNRTLQGFNLGFDFGSEGLGFEPFFGSSASDFTPASAIFGTTSITANPDRINYDFELNGSGGSLLLDEFDSPTDAAELATISFEIAGNAAVGFYDFEFESPANVQTLLSGVQSINSTFGNNVVTGLPGSNAILLTPLGGQFQIVAIPEPSSLLAISSLTAVGLFGRRRRR